MNGYKGGHWRKVRELSKALNALLREQREARAGLSGQPERARISR